LPDGIVAIRIEYTRYSIVLGLNSTKSCIRFS